MIWTALLLGFAGSLHCIGMCSPLAALVTRARPLSNRIVYNLGRVVPYAMLGAMAGTFGSLIQFPQLQFWLALGLGISLVALGITGKSFTVPCITPLIIKFTSKMKQLFSTHLSKNNSSIFFLGMLNGFIPCGLTYVAVSYCILLPSALDGTLFMAVFGLGTLPAMVTSPWILSKAANYFSLSSKKTIAIAIIILGCSVIARAAFVNYSSLKKGNTELICK